MSVCQVVARWPVPQPADRYERQEDAAFGAAFREMAAEPEWLPPVPEWDDETQAAMSAWRDEGIARTYAANAIGWPDRVPFRIDHLGAPVAELQVDRLDDVFEAFGELDEAVAARLSGLEKVSPTVQTHRARIVDTGALRYVEVTEALVVELSAVHNAGLEGTALLCGNPGDKWVPRETVERFSRLAGSGSVRLAFPTTFEVD